MLYSDGCQCQLMQSRIPGNGKALKVEWVEMTSFANELPTCMFMGAESEENGDLRSWKSFSNQERIDRSLFVVKQDVKLLGNHAVPYWAKTYQILFRETQSITGYDFLCTASCFFHVLL